MRDGEWKTTYTVCPSDEVLNVMNKFFNEVSIEEMNEIYDRIRLVSHYVSDQELIECKLVLDGLIDFDLLQKEKWPISWSQVLTQPTINIMTYHTAKLKYMVDATCELSDVDFTNSYIVDLNSNKLIATQYYLRSPK
jgi:hypothetical protein